MTVYGSITDYDGEKLTVKVDDVSRELLQKQVGEVEIRLDDGRTITAEQRRKAYAIIGDVARWSGHEPEDAKSWLKFYFMAQTGADAFSLSDTDVTTAREFIDYLIQFCFENNVPTRTPLLMQCDDIGKYLYRCLEQRRCAICNAPADVHHVDAVGMGRNRDKIIHEGMNAIALCRVHHNEAHARGRDFFNYYHVSGIKLDAYLCEKLNLRGTKQDD